MLLSVDYRADWLHSDERAMKSPITEGRTNGEKKESNRREQESGDIPKDEIIRPRISTILVNERLTTLVEGIHHVVRKWDGLENRAVVVFDEGEVLFDAAMFILLATAARTGSISGEFFAGHDAVSIGCRCGQCPSFYHP